MLREENFVPPLFPFLETGEARWGQGNKQKRLRTWAAFCFFLSFMLLLLLAQNFSLYPYARNFLNPNKKDKVNKAN